MLRNISLVSILPACRESCTSKALVLFKRRKRAQGVHPLINLYKQTAMQSFQPPQYWTETKMLTQDLWKLSSIKNRHERNVFLQLQFFQAILATSSFPSTF